MKPPHDGAKVFIKNKSLGKYLFFLRDDRSDIPNPNRWGLLGGGINQGETPIEALTRELKEESNVVIEDIELLGNLNLVLQVEGRQYEIINHFFLAETDYDLKNIKLYEGQKIDYFTLEEIQKMDNVASTVSEAVKLFKDKLA